MTPEMIREFEKAGKAIAKMRGNEIIFDDEPGRMHFIYLAMNKDEENIDRIISEIISCEDGMRHIVRTLNNVRTIAHEGSLFFCKRLYRAIEPTFEDAGVRLQKWIQIVDAVSPLLRTDLGWISETSMKYLDDRDFSSAQKMDVWLHWCAAMLRANNLSGVFIDTVGATRPKDLNRAAINQLKQMLQDTSTRWDLKSGALYLLLGNQLLSLDTAQAFVEEAYAGFPLDALEGVETLAIAVEHDAAIHAEADAIHEKLAQLRREGLVLKDMKHGDLFEASCAVFENLGNIPTKPIEIAVHLFEWGKRERLIVSAFIDETRKADWMRIAAKVPEDLRKLACLFFEHFDATNPVLRQFAVDVAGALVDNCNVDALRAERLVALCASDDEDALADEARHWADLLRTPERP